LIMPFLEVATLFKPTDTCQKQSRDFKM